MNPNQNFYKEYLLNDDAYLDDVKENIKKSLNDEELNKGDFFEYDNDIYYFIRYAPNGKIKCNKLINNSIYTKYESVFGNEGINSFLDKNILYKKLELIPNFKDKIKDFKKDDIIVVSYDSYTKSVEKKLRFKVKSIEDNILILNRIKSETIDTITDNNRDYFVYDVNFEKEILIIY